MDPWESRGLAWGLVEEEWAVESGLVEALVSASQGSDLPSISPSDQGRNLPR